MNMLVDFKPVCENFTYIRDPPSSASPVLGVMVGATKSNLFHFILVVLLGIQSCLLKWQRPGICLIGLIVSLVVNPRHSFCFDILIGFCF